MAARKREDWEIERDRSEIAVLLARNRRVLHKQIADILNRRRREEYETALADDPDAPEPYTLTRQMIDYEVRALKRQWRKQSQTKIEQLVDAQLNEIDELARAAWEGYERSIRAADTLTKATTAVEVDAVALDESDQQIKSIKLPAVKTIETRKREQLIGNPRFLEVVAEQIRARNDLLGLTSNDLNVTVLPTDIKLVAGFNPVEWDKKENQSGDDTKPAESPNPVP